MIEKKECVNSKDWTEEREERLERYRKYKERYQELKKQQENESVCGSVCQQ